MMTNTKKNILAQTLKTHTVIFSEEMEDVRSKIL